MHIFSRIKNTIFLILVLAIEFKPLVSTVILSERESAKDLNIEIHNALPWRNDDLIAKIENVCSDANAIPIIRIDTPFDGYDPCDETAFSPSIMRAHVEDRYSSLLQQNETTKMTHSPTFNESLDWIALADNNQARNYCGKTPMHMLYSGFIGLSAQKLGAIAGVRLLTSTDISELERVTAPGVNIESKSFGGVKLNIPVFAIDMTDEGSEASYYMSDSLVIKSLNIDFNAYLAMYQRGSLFHFTWICLSFFSLYCAIYIGKYSKRVFEFYKDKNDVRSKVAFRMRVLILIPELLGCILKFVSFLDPVGGFHYTDFILGRMIFSFAVTMAMFADIATILFCWDVYTLFKASKNMKPASPFMVKYKFAGTAILLLGILMVIGDQIILYSGLTGELGGSVTTLPLLIHLISIMVVVGILLTISSKMKREVQANLSRLNKNFTSLLAKETDDDAEKIMSELGITTSAKSFRVKSPASSIDTTDVSTMKTRATNRHKVKPDEEPNDVNNVGTRTKSTKEIDTNKKATRSKINLQLSKYKSVSTLMRKTEKFARMRQKILWVAFSRFGAILGYILFGVFRSSRSLTPPTLMMCMLFLGGFNSLGSYFQILVALQLPMKNPK